MPDLRLNWRDGLRGLRPEWPKELLTPDAWLS
jgi:hypothetical protein